MRFFSILNILSLGIGLATAIPAPQTSNNGHHGQTDTSKFPEGFHDEPDLDLAQTPKTPGAQRKKFRYGPYSVKAQGMISNRPVLSADVPCKNCYITAIQAGLEYADGTSANVNTGAWLHHMVLSIRGTGHKDLVCTLFGLAGARTYASGNERTVMRVNNSGNYGFKIGATDRFSMIVDLMNMSNQSKQLYLTMTYEFVTTTSGYRPAAVAWLDITGCGVSAVRAKEGKYDLTSPGWRSSVNGPMLYATGHVHDGGIYTQILQNGKPVCQSNQVYGASPDFIDDMPMAGMPEMKGNAHISNTGACINFGTVKVGDDLKVLAHYDTDKQPLAMEMPGESPEVMGISRVVIGQ